MQASEKETVSASFIRETDRRSVFFPPKLQIKLCYFRLKVDFQSPLLLSGPGAEIRLYRKLFCLFRLRAERSISTHAHLLAGL